MLTSRVSLEQWKALQAVIDYGGYAQAAEKMHRSQSSVSYAVNRLQELLGLQVLRIEGRKAVLTDAGKILLQRSRQLLADASSLESLARQIKKGWEAEVRLTVEAAFPTQYLMQALKEFEPYSQNTQVRLNEVVLSGAEENLLSGSADLAITPFIPQGFLGEELVQVSFIAVAHPDHALHQLNSPISIHDLNRETHVILSDSGSKGVDSGWISDARRWTVTSPESAIKIISNGLGFGWLPEKSIEKELKNKELVPLELEKGQRQKAILYLVYADQNQVGPATRKLAEILKQVSYHAGA